jgi:hypothetical protein
MGSFRDDLLREKHRHLHATLDMTLSIEIKSESRNLGEIAFRLFSKAFSSKENLVASREYDSLKRTRFSPRVSSRSQRESIPPPVGINTRLYKKPTLLEKRAASLVVDESLPGWLLVSTKRRSMERTCCVDARTCAVAFQQGRQAGNSWLNETKNANCCCLTNEERETLCVRQLICVSTKFG